MNPIVRILLIAVFVGGTFGALAVPIINASDEILEPVDAPTPEPTPEESDSPEPEPSPSASAEPSPSPSPEEEGILTGLAYPRTCLDQPAEPPANPGLVAYDDGDGVVIADPTGGTAGRITGEMAPVDWSVTGTYLVAGSGRVYTAESDHVGKRPSGTHRSVWSPLADCLLLIDDQIEVMTPDETRVVVSSPDAPIGSTRFNLDGTRLGVTVGGVPGVYDLASEGLFRRGHVEPGARCGAGSIDPTTIPGVADALSLSCSPDGRFLAAIAGATDQAPTANLYRRDGSIVVDLAPDRNYVDTYVLWGRRGAGLIFVRDPGIGVGEPQIWYIPEGGSARDTGLRPRRPRDDERWADLISWSVASPDGRADLRGR